MSVVFATLGVVLKEQAEGGEAKEKGLHEPQVASGCVVDAFVTAGTQKKQLTQSFPASKILQCLLIQVPFVTETSIPVDKWANK